MKKYKIVQYGCGKMSKFTMKYVYDLGSIIVGAFDINPDLIGKDIGSIMNTDYKGIIIENNDNIKNRLKELKPDCVIVTTMSLLKDVKDILIICASLGINAITTCEEAFYPKNSNPNLHKEIDELAKKNNCTITGCGYQDVFWGNLITSIASSSHNITSIKGNSSYNVEEYGIALAKAHGVSLSIDEFNKMIASYDNINEHERKKLIDSGNFLPSYMWNVNGWLCDKLGLTILSQTQKCIPKIDNYDIYSETLKTMIKKGNVTGMSAVVTSTTKEGITLTTECIGKVYSKEEFDKNEWTISGDAKTTIIVNKPDTVRLTCADIVNRIPNLIDEKPGFIPTSKFMEGKYYFKSID